MDTKYIKFLGDINSDSNSELLDHVELLYYMLFESVENLHTMLNKFANKFNLPVSRWDSYVKKEIKKEKLEKMKISPFIGVIKQVFNAYKKTNTRSYR
jgi:hypothetical protein